MIVTEGGRFGGYALFLSPPFNWWSHANFFRNIALLFVALGLFLVWRGKKKNWGRFKMIASKTVLTLSALLIVSVFMTNVFK